jgi:uncharacterized protein
VVASDSQNTPQLEGRVTDKANLLSISDRDHLANLLEQCEQETSHQIGVLVIPTLSGEDIESFSLRVAKAWGLGRKGLDNGILVTLAVNDGKIRIELGLGMQKYITNEMAGSIITDAMVPAFRKGDYSGGLQAGLELLMKQARQFVVTPDRQTPNNIVTNPQELIDQIISASIEGDENKVEEIKKNIESNSSPIRGDRKVARKLNDDAIAKLKENDFQSAATLLSSALQADSSDTEIASNLCYALIKSGKSPQAQEPCRHSITLKPDRAAAWANLAEVFADKGDLKSTTALLNITFHFSTDKDKTKEFFQKHFIDGQQNQILIIAANAALSNEGIRPVTDGVTQPSPVQTEPIIEANNNQPAPESLASNKIIPIVESHQSDLTQAPPTINGLEKIDDAKTLKIGNFSEIAHLGAFFTKTAQFSILTITVLIIGGLVGFNLIKLKRAKADNNVNQIYQLVDDKSAVTKAHENHKNINLRKSNIGTNKEFTGQVAYFYNNYRQLVKQKIESILNRIKQKSVIKHRIAVALGSFLLLFWYINNAESIRPVNESNILGRWSCPVNQGSNEYFFEGNQLKITGNSKELEHSVFSGPFSLSGDTLTFKVDSQEALTNGVEIYTVNGQIISRTIATGNVTSRPYTPKIDTFIHLRLINNSLELERKNSKITCTRYAETDQNEQSDTNQQQKPITIVRKYISENDAYWINIGVTANNLMSKNTQPMCRNIGGNLLHIKNIALNTPEQYRSEISVSIWDEAIETLIDESGRYNCNYL